MSNSMGKNTYSSNSSFNSLGSNGDILKEMVYCECGYKVSLKTSCTNMNPGRRFLACQIMSNAPLRFLSIIGAFVQALGLHCILNTGIRTCRMTFEFGRTHVVRPKGRHQATVVWLHGLGDRGSSWSQLLESLPLPNVKWICPTAPTRPVSLFGGFPSTAWFDAQDISENAPEDFEGLDAAAAHVANLLSTEPADIKLGVGGFSMGAAAALYSATCHIFSQYGNRNPYPVNLSCVVGLSGWLPCSRTLRSRMTGSNETVRAASLPILLCHGSGDDVVAYKHGEKSAQILHSTGFQNLRFRSYDGLGHYTIPEEMDEVCQWLTDKLALLGS